MAASASHELEIEEDPDNLVECQTCCEIEGYLLNPKLLPCGHIFCVPCITDHQKDPAQIICSKCKSSTQTSLDELESALKGMKTFCDTCTKIEGEMFMTANVYCPQCDMKYCNRHHKVHDSLNSHNMMTIKEYLRSSLAEELRYCTEHKSEIYCLGCEKCYVMFCSECVNIPTCCSNGEGHKIISLKKLAEKVKASVEPQKAKVEDKLDEVSAVVKEATILLSEWDTDTQHGVRLLNQTRAQQLLEINEKYDSLKKEYMDSREADKERISDFIAEEAGVIQAEYLKQLKVLRADLSYKHPVDVVTERLETDERIQELGEQQFPCLVLNMVRLATNDEVMPSPARLSLIPGPDLVLGKRPPVHCPSALGLMRHEKSKDSPLAVCHHELITYIGHTGNAIDRVDAEGGLTKNFIKLKNAVISVRAHKDQIFVLVYGQPYKINTYDLSGQLISSRAHGDRNETSVSGNKMCITQEHLVVCNLSHQKIDCYPLQYFANTCPEVLNLGKGFNCPLIGKGTHVSMCKINDSSVVITNYVSNCVFRFSFDIKCDQTESMANEGKVDWVTKEVIKPEGVACYGEKYILVTAAPFPETRIWIIDSETGIFIRNIAAPAQVISHVYDLHLVGDFLVVPRRNENRVYYYYLMCEMKKRGSEYFGSQLITAVNDLS